MLVAFEGRRVEVVQSLLNEWLSCLVTVWFLWGAVHCFTVVVMVMVVISVIKVFEIGAGGETGGSEGAGGSETGETALAPSPDGAVHCETETAGPATVTVTVWTMGGATGAVTVTVWTMGGTAEAGETALTPVLEGGITGGLDTANAAVVASETEAGATEGLVAGVVEEPLDGAVAGPSAKMSSWAPSRNPHCSLYIGVFPEGGDTLLPSASAASSVLLHSSYCFPRSPTHGSRRSSA